MSFKREGDDISLLRNLQHRRVADLIGDYIPDEEAALLSNGRLTCLVCARRPIFDTIPMLSVHRKGKKHMIELSKYLSQKRELERRKLKQELELSLQPGTSPSESPLAPATLGKRLLTTTTPYSSCTKRRPTNKNKLHGWDRKTVLDVECSKVVQPGLREIEDGLPSTTSEVRKYLKELWKKKALKKTVEESRMNYGVRTVANTTQVQLSRDRTLEATPSSSVNKHLAQGSLVPDQTQCASASSSSQQKSSVSQLAQSDMNIRMSGWIQDKKGCWIKDPEAEFDSDDDESPSAPIST